MKNIELVVCDHYGVTPSEMREDLRERKYTVPRYIIYYLTSFYEDVQDRTIGARYNHDAGTVYQGKKRVNKLIETDKCFWLTIEELKFKINPGISIKSLGQITEI